MNIGPAPIALGLPAAAAATELLDRHKAELRQAFLIRRTEQKLLSLYAEGKLFGTVHTYIGQEFSRVAAGGAMAPHDIVFSNHRGHRLDTPTGVEG